MDEYYFIVFRAKDGEGSLIASRGDKNCLVKKLEDLVASRAEVSGGFYSVPYYRLEEISVFCLNTLSRVSKGEEVNIKEEYMASVGKAINKVNL